MGDNGETSIIVSPYMDVNNQKYYMTFDIYATSASTYCTPDGGIFVGTKYYDENKSNVAEKVSGNNWKSNGWAQKAPLNTWTSMTHGYGKSSAYGFKYLVTNFTADGYYGKTPIK